MLKRIQRHPYTVRGRYPDVLHRLAVVFTDEPQRILCFGCSTGEECVDLAALFPSAQITGVEIRSDLRANAEVTNPHKRVRYVHPEDASDTGPFDLITCHSVLCHYPAKHMVVNDAWTFREFEALLTQLDSVISVGGWLSVVNAEYEFAATRLCRERYAADPARRKSEPAVRVFDARNTATERGRKPLPFLFQKVRP